MKHLLQSTVKGKKTKSLQKILSGKCSSATISSRKMLLFSSVVYLFVL